MTQASVVRSEWTKLRTLRSTRWSLLAAVVGDGRLGILVAAVQMTRWTHLEPARPRRLQLVDSGVGGFHLAQLAIGVLGVLVISGEYSTGMIRSSFMAVTERLPVLWAKIAVFCVGHLRVHARVNVVSFFVVQALVDPDHVQQAIGDPHALRVVVGTALFLTVLGVLAIGIGALVRNTAGGIAFFVFLLFVLPGITLSCPATTADSVNPYLPLNAGFAVATSTFEDSHHLAPGQGSQCSVDTSWWR